MRRRLSPRTLVEGQRLRTLALAHVSSGEAVHALGFDWRLVFSAKGKPTDPLTSRLVLGTQSNLCWRALLYIGESDEDQRTKIHVLHVGGGESYAMYYHHDTGNLSWCLPENSTLEQLRRLVR